MVFVGKCLSQDFKENLTAKQILRFDGSMGWIEAMEAINLVFEENHSTLLVHNEFMTMRKKQGESETNFLGRLTSVGIHCDMASMATEDWIATRYLASCPNNIREEILKKHERPSMGQIKNFIEKLETLKFQNNQLNTPPPGREGGCPRGQWGRNFQSFS